MTDGPWSWRPSRHAWNHSFASAAVQWTPARALSLHQPALASAVVHAADRDDDWLWHPAASRLTDPDPPWRAQSDIMLAAWIATNVDDVLGTVTVPAGTGLSAPDGTTLSPGVYDLSSFEMPTGRPFCVDAHGSLTGHCARVSWLGTRLAPRGDTEPLDAQIAKVDEGVAILLQLPDICDWSTQITKVIVPQPTDDANRSQSNTLIPGAAWIGGADGIGAAEGIVHESAHGYVAVLEAQSPLVRDDQEARYASPLRDDLRPLRKVFLAYHAISYIGAFYLRALGAALVDPQRSEAPLSWFSDAAHDAYATLSSAHSQFTPAGLDALARTKAIADGWTR